MKTLMQGFFIGEKFVQVQEYTTIGQILVIQDAASGNYFIGTEEEDYVPKYDKYEVYKQEKLLIAFHNVYCDVFSLSGEKILCNKELRERPNSVSNYFIFEEKEKEAISLFNGSETVITKEIQSFGSLTISKEVSGEQILYDNNLKKICTCTGFQIQEIYQFKNEIYIVATKKGLRGQGLFFIKKEQNSYINLLDCELEDLIESKILALKHELVYWDDELKSFVAENNNQKTLVTKKGKLLHNSTAYKIKAAFLNCYICYHEQDMVSIIKNDGPLLPKGVYDLNLPHQYTSFDYSNFYMIDDTYKYEHVQILVVKNKQDNHFMKLLWGHPLYTNTYDLGKVSEEISDIEYFDKDYLYLKGRTVKFLFYQDELLGEFPSSACISPKFGEHGINPEIHVTTKTGKKVFYLGSLYRTEVEKSSAPESIPKSKQETLRERANFYSSLLLDIDENPYKAPEKEHYLL